MVIFPKKGNADYSPTTACRMHVRDSDSIQAIDMYVTYISREGCTRAGVPLQIGTLELSTLAVRGDLVLKLNMRDPDSNCAI